MINLVPGELVKTNLNATTDPVTSNDIAEGYTTGSTWFNESTSPRRAFLCLDSTEGAAIWIQITNSIDNTDSPGQYLLGSILDYSISGNLPQGEIQYTRIFLIAGLVITGVEVFVDSGGNSNRDLRVGLYDQVDPHAISADPNDRLVQSDSTPTNGLDNQYSNIPFTSAYLIPESGFYWIALVGDSNSIKLVVTAGVYRAEYPPVRRESTSNNVLPATAGSLTNPQSAIAFAAATE